MIRLESCHLLLKQVVIKGGKVLTRVGGYVVIRRSMARDNEGRNAA